MKRIEAIVRTGRAGEVLDTLAAAGVENVTIMNVLAVGPNLDPDRTQVSMEFGRRVNQMVRLEVVVPDRDETRVTEALRDAACTGRPGDGIIGVQNLNRLVKIRSGAESLDAL